MKQRQRILALFICFVVVVFSIPNTANAASIDYDKYQFTWEVSAYENHYGRTARSTRAEIYFFDFDNNIVVLVHYRHHKMHSGPNSEKPGTTKYEYEVYKLIQNSEGLMSIIDFDGKESSDHFMMEGILFKKILVCDSRGNSIPSIQLLTDKNTMWESKTIKDQPPTQLEKSGFYKKYPDPDRLLAKFKD